MMDAQGEAIVRSARSYIGTRFCHQGRRKASQYDRGGVDCLGLLVGVARECALMKDGMPLCAFDECDYGHIPDAKRLYKALNVHLLKVEKTQVKPADVLLIEMDSSPQHVGIVADGKYGLNVIHAYAPARGVVEHRLDDEWWQKVKAVFRFAAD